MDRGLTKAVDRFVKTIEPALRTAAAGTSVDVAKLERTLDLDLSRWREPRGAEVKA